MMWVLKTTKPPHNVGDGVRIVKTGLLDKNIQKSVFILSTLTYVVGAQK